jgi:uncharacterized BrkB/YihY/UPF0761 family membrane protein
MRASVRRVLDIAKGGGLHFCRSHGFVYSAAIAFNILLASIPVLFLVFAAASMVIGRNDMPFAMLTSFLKGTFPYGAQVLVPNLRKLFASGATFGLVGTLLLLVSSFSATDAVHSSLSVMIGTTRRKRFLRSAVFHVTVVLVLIVLTSAAILVPPLWKGFVLLTPHLSGQWDLAFHALLDAVADLFLAVIIFGASVLSYRYLSPRLVTMKNALSGSLIFLCMMYAIKTGFVFYVKKFSRLNVIYGSLFSIICFIIVAYLFSAAFLFCASIIGTLEKGEGKEAFPEKEQIQRSEEA